MPAAERRIVAQHDPAFDGDPATAVRARVLLPLPLAGAYDYRVPAGLDAPPGTLVEVPLGRRFVAGVVWDGAGDEGGVEASRLKDVAGRLDAPAFRAELRRFVDWVAAYSLAPPGTVLRPSARPVIDCERMRSVLTGSVTLVGSS